MRLNPIPYVGGKSRAVPLLLPMFPEGVDVCSPFLGGGHLELALGRAGHRVYGYDNWPPIANLWECLLADPERVWKGVMGHYPITEETRGNNLKERYFDETDKWERAALVFIIAGTSFGSILFNEGGRSMEWIDRYFTLSKINRLRNFKAPNLSVELMDFHDSIQAQRETTWLFCDPPYYSLEYLYGGGDGKYYKESRTTFQHHDLMMMLKGRRNWVLTYGDHPVIRDLYSWADIQDAEWSHSAASTHKRGQELVIRPRGQVKHELGLFSGVA